MAQSPIASHDTAAIAQFDRRIAVQELIEAAQSVARFAGHLRSVGAITATELEEYRGRPKTEADVAEGLSAKMIRAQAETYRTEAGRLEARYAVAQRLAQAVGAESPSAENEGVGAEAATAEGAAPDPVVRKRAARKA